MAKNDKLHNCPYCGCRIPVEFIRCGKCDHAWQDGRSAGVKETRRKISEVLKSLLNLGKWED